MILSAKAADKPVGQSAEHPESFEPIDRRRFSETALSLLDQHRIDNANDPMAIFISIVMR